MTDDGGPAQRNTWAGLSVGDRRVSLARFGTGLVQTRIGGTERVRPEDWEPSA